MIRMLWTMPRIVFIFMIGLPLANGGGPNYKVLLHDQYMKEWEEAKAYRDSHANKTVPKLLRASKANQGSVDYLVTFGSPGSGSPGLKSVADAGGCFPGIRSWTHDSSNGQSDPVPWITNKDWFWHPLMDGQQMVLGDGNKDVVHTCSDPKVIGLPTGSLTDFVSDLYLHYSKSYNPAILASHALRAPNLYKTLFALSYVRHDIAEYQKTQKALNGEGYQIVGFARYPGSWDTGEQVSYLVQHESNLDCFVTFQGTQDNADFVTDAAAYAVSFCGLVEKGDSCCHYSPICFGECKPRGNGISFVHQGFRNNLRRMVSTPAWQATIKAKLPQCKSVRVIGHSLGGAMSELFTSCVQQNLQDGDYGYEDYKLMAWTNGSPQKLEPLSAKLHAPQTPPASPCNTAVATPAPAAPAENPCASSAPTPAPAANPCAPSAPTPAPVANPCASSPRLYSEHTGGQHKSVAGQVWESGSFALPTLVMLGVLGSIAASIITVLRVRARNLSFQRSSGAAPELLKNEDDVELTAVE